MAAKKTAKKDETAGVSTTDSVTSGRVPAGAQINPTRDEPSLDPELAKIRDEEAKALSDIKIETTRPDASIDDELVKARDAEIKAAADFNKSQS